MISVINHYMNERLDLNKTDTFTMICLADYADEKGECWPSVPALAKKLRVKDRAAQTALARLEDDGELLIVPDAGAVTQGGRTSRYVLLSYRDETEIPIPELWIKQARERRARNQKRGAKSTTPPPQRGAKPCTTSADEKEVQNRAVDPQRGATGRAKEVQNHAPGNVIGNVNKLEPSVGIDPRTRANTQSDSDEPPWRLIQSLMERDGILVMMGERERNLCVQMAEQYQWPQIMAAERKMAKAYRQKPGKIKYPIGYMASILANGLDDADETPVERVTRMASPGYQPDSQVAAWMNAIDTAFQEAAD